MDRFSVLSGQVSHVATTATVRGSVRRGKGSVSTSHKTDFRVDGKAAVFKASVNIADGDRVTLTGKEKRGEFHARAIRNEETGVIHSGMTTLAYVLGAVMIIVGIPLCIIAVGFIIVGLGAWLIYEGYMNHLAAKQLEGI